VKPVLDHVPDEHHVLPIAHEHGMINNGSEEQMEQVTFVGYLV
jgi:hypothetical protein